MIRVAIPYLIPISLSLVLDAPVFLSTMLKHIKVYVRTTADAAFYILLFIGLFYFSSYSTLLCFWSLLHHASVFVGVDSSTNETEQHL